jgi:hypothetical protein
MGRIAIDIDTACAATGAASEARRGALPCRAQFPSIANGAACAAVLRIELRIDAALIALEQPAAAGVAGVALCRGAGSCARDVGIRSILWRAAGGCPCISQ